MKRVQVRIVGVLIVVCGLPLLAQQSPGAPANAAVPTLVNFSGVLTDADSKPLNGVVGVTFSLYKDQQGGASLWLETQNVRPDKTGHYGVMLGSTNSSGLPPDIFVAGEARWLGVQVQGQPEQPRVLLLSVPYALKSMDAETLGGKPVSAFVLAETGSRPGDTGAITSATSGKTITAQPLASVTGTGTTNRVAKFTGTSSIGNSAIFESGGRVGIGNTSPAATLDVSGNTFIRSTLNLSQTTSSSVGVINMGSVPFIHACCSALAHNTFVGTNAGNFTTTGNSNTASGFQSLRSNTSGFSNTASGASALLSNKTGFNNTALGVSALLLNIDGDGNTATGHNALGANTGGGDNTASGDSALAKNTTGAHNTGTGVNALFSNTTGNFNSALGNHADVSAPNLVNATAIGASATVGESNALVLGCLSTNCPTGTSPPKVGIGTSTPFSTLDVVAPNQTGLLVRGPFSGVGAGLDLQTTGTGTDILQWEILDTGAFAAQGSHKLNIRNVNTGNDILTILANGEVGIETTSPDNTLTVNGSADKPGGGSWGTFSDGRLKTVHGNFNSGLSQILKINPVRYRYKEDNAMGIRDRDEHIGLVAQEVQKVIPEAVTENKKGYLLVNNDPIIWTMLNAIKEQQRQIRKQQQQIRAQQSLVKGEQAEIARLSSLVKAMQASISTNGRTGSEIRTARATVTMVRQ